MASQRSVQVSLRTVEVVPLGDRVVLGHGREEVVELARSQGFLGRTTFVLGGECVKAVAELKSLLEGEVRDDPVHRAIYATDASSTVKGGWA